MLPLSCSREGSLVGRIGLLVNSVLLLSVSSPSTVQAIKN